MLTDGALRMLVLLHFHTLGFSPVQLAYLFVLYEIAGVVTNLSAGWIAARFGLTRTLYAGLGLQVVALLALTQLDPTWAIGTSVAFVMLVQGASGVAKDLSKMSAKSAVKLLAPTEGDGLFRWVAALTGSKNAVKGLGFLLGAALSGDDGVHSGSAGHGGRSRRDSRGDPRHHATGTAYGPQERQVLRGLLQIAQRQLAECRARGAVWRAGRLVRGRHPDLLLRGPVGRERGGQPRGVLHDRYVHGGLDHPLRCRAGCGPAPPEGRVPARGGADRLRPPVGCGACGGAALLAIAVGMTAGPTPALTAILVAGLLVFGGIFAVNSSLHSYLILAFTKSERVTMDVGFYYMANAAGRLIGTVLSGLTYQIGGLSMTLGTAAIMLVCSAWAAGHLRAEPRGQPAQ
jgi:MFS family permease